MVRGRGGFRAAGASLVVLMALVAVPQVAVAQEGGPDGEIDVEELDIGKYEKECLELLLEGGTARECQQATDPLVPPTFEVIWSLIGFTVVALGLAKFALPRARRAMADRTERIRGDLDAAAAARREAEAVVVEYQAQLDDARAEADRIVSEAREHAEALKEEQAQRTEVEFAAMRARNQADIEAIWAQSADDLRREVSAILAAGTDHVVRSGLDAGTQARLIDEYIASLEHRNN